MHKIIEKHSFSPFLKIKKKQGQIFIITDRSIVYKMTTLNVELEVFIINAKCKQMISYQ